MPALDRALTFVNVIDSSLPRTKKANPCPLRHDGYVTTFSADIVAVLQKVSLLFVFDFMVEGLCTHSSHDIYVLFLFLIIHHTESEKYVFCHKKFLPCTAYVHDYRECLSCAYVENMHYKYV